MSTEKVKNQANKYASLLIARLGNKYLFGDLGGASVYYTPLETSIGNVKELLSQLELLYKSMEALDNTAADTPEREQSLEELFGTVVDLLAEDIL